MPSESVTVLLWKKTMDFAEKPDSNITPLKMNILSQLDLGQQ